jgi:hypothetical protein
MGPYFGLILEHFSKLDKFISGVNISSDLKASKNGVAEMKVLTYLRLDVEEISGKPRSKASSFCKLWDGPLPPVGTLVNLPSEYGATAVVEDYTIHMWHDKRRDEFAINLVLDEGAVDSLNTSKKNNQNFWKTLIAKGWVPEDEIEKVN